MAEEITAASVPVDPPPAARDEDRTPRTGGGGHESGGPRLDLQHGVRTMKVYPITESDVLTLKLTTALSATMFAIGAAFIGYAINIYVNASFYTELTPQAQVMVKAGAPLSLAVGVAFFVAGAVATISRWITWARVKKFTTTQPVPLVPQ